MLAVRTAKPGPTKIVRKGTDTSENPTPVIACPAAATATAMAASVSPKLLQPANDAAIERAVRSGCAIGAKWLSPSQTSTRTSASRSA